MKFVGIVATIILFPGIGFTQSTDRASLQQGKTTATGAKASKITSRQSGKSGQTAPIKGTVKTSKSSRPAGHTPKAETIARAGDKSPLHPSSPPKTVVPLPTVPTETPIISYFNQDTKGWLHAGEIVHITMQGTPGGKATFRVAGLSESVSMQESSPGQYLGRWTVPKGKPLIGMQSTVTGDLTNGTRAATPIQAPRPLCVDTTPPIVMTSLPQPQSTITTQTPTLSVEFKDEGSGVDVSSVSLHINGRDFTGEANVSTDHLTFKPILPLPVGDQSIEIVVADNAGNRTHHAWHFTIAIK